MVGAIRSSVTANVPIASPLTRAGSRSFLISSLAKFIKNSVNIYTDDEKGVGARDFPNSSAITHNSKCDKPKPSYDSGILMPVHPSSTIFSHKSLSK